MEKSQNRKPFQALRDLFHPVDLTHGTCWRTILQFSLPVILSYLLQQVYTISDAAIVGQTLTAQEVAGVNDTSSLVFIFLQFAFGVSAGFCVITSCCVGCRDQAGVRRSMAAQLVLSAGLTVLLTALALVLLNPMLAWINVTPENPEVYRAAYTYCGIIFAGIGAQLFYNFICSFLRSMGDSVTPLLFLLGSTVLNVALDLLFILVLHWGVAGAAGATVTAQLISTVACFAYAFSKYPDLRLHKEDWRITGLDLKRHIVQGVPLGLQFSVLVIGIIVMQSVVVKFDMIDGQMVSHAAQNGFGAANKLNSLIMTPVNGLGTAMTSFTAQNLGAGYTHRIRKGILQGLVMAAIIGVCSVGLGLLLTIDGAYLHIFLSADKVTADTIRFGNHFLYVDFSMYLLLCFLFVIRNCVQGIQRAPFVLWAGASELIARVAICLTLPALLSGGVVSAQSPELAFYALCAADPLAWLAADLALLVPFFKNMMHMNYQYLYGGVEQHLLGKMILIPPKKGQAPRSSACPFSLSSGFLVRPVLQQIAGLTVQSVAELVQRLHPHRLGLAGFQNGEIGHGDAHPLRQLRQTHFPPGQHYVNVEYDHAPPSLNGHVVLLTESGGVTDETAEHIAHDPHRRAAEDDHGGDDNGQRSAAGPHKGQHEHPRRKDQRIGKGQTGDAPHIPCIPPGEGPLRGADAAEDAPAGEHGPEDGQGEQPRPDEAGPVGPGEFRVRLLHLPPVGGQEPEEKYPAQHRCRQQHRPQQGGHGFGIHKAHSFPCCAYHSSIISVCQLFFIVLR